MDGMAIHDAEGLFIYSYAAQAQNLGYEGLGELIGKNSKRPELAATPT